MNNTIAKSLAVIRDRLAAAAARSGRKPEEVTLVAVSKNVAAAALREAISAGQRTFGENRVQEAREKIGELGADLIWHLIGHLQKNKVKAAIDLFDVVETVDTAELALELNRRAIAAGRRPRVLVQVKLGSEETKNGVDPAEAPALIETIASLPGLDLSGLMAIPPLPRTPEDSRPFFAALCNLREKYDGIVCPRGALRDLSMGMSADYEVAVEEGATIIRVGTALFGNRS